MSKIFSRCSVLLYLHSLIRSVKMYLILAWVITELVDFFHYFSRGKGGEGGGGGGGGGGGRIGLKKFL